MYCFRFVGSGISRSHQVDCWFYDPVEDFLVTLRSTGRPLCCELSATNWYVHCTVVTDTHWTLCIQSVHVFVPLVTVISQVIVNWQTSLLQTVASKNERNYSGYCYPVYFSAKCDFLVPTFRTLIIAINTSVILTHLLSFTDNNTNIYILCTLCCA